MSDDSEELTPEERKLAIRLVTGFYIISLVLTLFVFCAIAYAGFLGWAWTIVIPIGGASMFATRVLKKYSRSMMNRVIAAAASSDEADAKPAVEGQSGARLTPKLIVLVSVTMTVVSALWYALGVGLRWAIGGSSS